MAFPVSAPRRHARLSLTIFLSLALIGTSSVASAGWLDKLKKTFGGDDEKKEQPLSTDEVGGGLKDALRVGTENVVGMLGKEGGFNLDPAVHIPLPGQLEQAKKLLGKVGMDSTLEDLELRLNRAAEIATPKAKALFMDAINEMTLDDVMAIYNGPEDSATQYFRAKMSAPLALEMKPVVDESLADAGAVKVLDAAMSRYDAIPFAPEVDANLSDYVVEKGMDGVFYYLAKEEAAIRQNPAKRTTDLLKRVFGG
ncbi:MAG: DUF4197 domain-containing protein [Gammaproteobacteria bacterium]|nr:DUF4197 domain-containing protein [Gammaproteobacteria bacterium]